MATKSQRQYGAELDYVGDVDIEYGGTFFDLSTFRHGYVSAVRVEDLASACGFDGAVLVERVTINGCDDFRRIRSAFRCCGITAKEYRAMDEKGRQLAIAETLLSYGTYDVVEDFGGRHQWVIQCEQDGPMKFDGWKADFRMSGNADLRGLIVNKYVDWA